MDRDKYIPLALSEVTVANGEADNPSEKRPPLQKADVLQWFQDSAEDDAAWVLTRLQETMPHLVFEILQPHTTSSVARHGKPFLHRSSSYIDDKETVRITRKRIRGGIKGDPVIQFSSPMYFAEEGVDDKMVLDVMRIGNQNMTSEVFYETEDDSAMNGRSYLATSGKLVFEPGVSLLPLEIPIINNDVWDTTLEFKCRLKPEGSKNAVLGQYLHVARVKIIDNNSFPTDNFSGLTTAKKD